MIATLPRRPSPGAAAGTKRALHSWPEKRIGTWSRLPPDCTTGSQSLRWAANRLPSSAAAAGSSELATRLALSSVGNQKAISAPLTLATDCESPSLTESATRRKPIRSWSRASGMIAAW